MGQLASAMGVTPGTATTMVKALNEAGLVHYEPYVGVRLLPAGERLAGLVIRRHRLVELFLVRVMGMSWDEVHDEAEKLEHVVSERLIERMDEMLGHPEVDPHGDPIPNAEGVVTERELHSLLTCPLGVPLSVTRVADQDAAFLRFLEQSHLKPGQELRVESRDEAADSVRVRCKDAEPLTIGARAASKLLVEVLSVAVFVLALMTSAWAQPPSPAPRARRSPLRSPTTRFWSKRPSTRNRVCSRTSSASCEVEEGGAWAITFTQEWPAPSMKHQLSYTATLVNVEDETGVGDTLVNYRYQLLEEGPGPPGDVAASVAGHPSGDEERGLGFGGWGWQFNLPVSKQAGDFYLHGNAGLTLVAEPAHRSVSRLRASRRPKMSRFMSPFIAGSAIYRAAADVQPHARERGRLARRGRGGQRHRPQHRVHPSRPACGEAGTSARSRSSSASALSLHAANGRDLQRACSDTSRTSCRSSRARPNRASTPYLDYIRLHDRASDLPKTATRRT